MERETFGTVIDVSEQWWFKLNTKALRTHSLDGAIFPHVVKFVTRLMEKSIHVANGSAQEHFVPPLVRR